MGSIPARVLFEINTNFDQPNFDVLTTYWRLFFCLQLPPFARTSASDDTQDSDKARRTMVVSTPKRASISNVVCGFPKGRTTCLKISVQKSVFWDPPRSELS